MQDFETLAKDLLRNAASLLNQWLPDGKATGFEYKALNPLRADNRIGSFSVNTVTGAWADFATGDKGGDLISLYAYLNGFSQTEAANRLSGERSEFKTETTNNQEKPVSVYKAITPIPERAGEPPLSSSNLGAPTKTWGYLDKDGKTIYYVCRFELSSGKMFKGISYGVLGGKEGWYWKSPPMPRPIYNLHLIKSRGTVVVCEGEKSADAAGHLFPNFATTTSPNGSSAARNADWSALKGKKVYIWPDNDEAGTKYALDVASLSEQAGALSVEIIPIPADKPSKWDAADALAEGWTPEQAMDLLGEEEEEFEPLFPLEDASVAEWIYMEPPRRRWIIKNFIPIGVTGIIVAPGATGKSQFSMQLAISIATGTPLCGYWPVEEQGGVLAIFGEDDTTELHRRLHNTVKQSRCEKDSLGKYFFAKSMVGKNNLLTKIVDKTLVRTGYADSLITVAKKIPDLKLILLDPISRFRGGDSNSDQDVTRFVEVLEYISSKTGATVICLHHVAKASYSNGAMSQSAARGSTALSDGVRWQMNMAGMSEQEAEKLGVPADERFYHVQVGIPMFNYGPPFGTHWLNRQQGGYLLYEKLSQDNKGDALQLAIERFIAMEYGAGNEWSKEELVRLHGGREERFRVSTSALSRAIDLLLRDDILTLRRSGGKDILTIKR